MSKDSIKVDDLTLINTKFIEFEKRLDILHESLKEMNNAIDMLVRFSMTAKAFMELSISQGMIDPDELNKLASKYETTYSDNLNIPKAETDFTSKFSRNLY
ncbi:hypothetical protein E3V55_04925 [Candidatus Marinimicrobia bacterium MT.SAG.3]|nr:hypothetical protein E3V55_04925 [Candidatus Marinimicrobia bacterium MT.SAG.3]